MHQQENAKIISEALLYCEVHSDSQLVSINLGEKKILKSQMLCTKCLIDLLNSGETSQKLIYIQDFMKNPGISFLKSIKINDSELKFDENEALQEIENLIIKIEGDFKTYLSNIRQNIQQMRSQIGSIVTELENNLKLDNLIKQFELLKTLDCIQGTRELNQFEEQLNFISLNLMSTYIEAKEKVKDNQKLLINDFENNFKIITNEVNEVIKKSLQLLYKIVNNEIPKIISDDLYQFPQIHNQISEGKQIQYQLLYQGSRDGLNVQAYWAKCNGQSNLLTIMTSKNGNKFGGYSPCVINSSLNNYVQDPTMKSFLFQYNKKEIYKLKNQTYAIYCNFCYGPTFGGGHDLNVAADFNLGYSMLGQSYDIAGYNITDKANHIFGATTPKLEECKVYKVIFL